MTEETGWLLEKMHNGNVHYICADYVLQWTEDPNKALRLSRREDAEALCTIVEDCEKIAQHEWCASHSESAPVSSPVSPSLKVEEVAVGEQELGPRSHVDDWPVADVLGHLASATEHLLRDHNCDEDGWEIWKYAAEAAWKHVALLNKPATTPVSPSAECAAEIILYANQTNEQQAREIVSAHSKHSVVVRQEQLVETIQVALSSRDEEIREVLEGLSIVMNYANGAVRCWCFSRDGLHSPPCVAARALYAKLQPKESSDVTE